MPKSTVKKEIPFIIFVSALLIGLLFDWVISKIDAAILSVLFAWFMYYTWRISKSWKQNNKQDDIKVMSLPKSIAFIIIWLSWLILGWKLIVDSAISIATWFGLPQAFVWVTIVAIWTSLPELAASVMSAFKKNTDMAIGWIVWSNIFNTLWILWATWLIHPLYGYDWVNIDLMMNLAVSMWIFLAAFTFKKNFLTKTEWGFLFLAYLWYISYLIYNLG
jgi:cation:H+ antiporter